MLKYKKEICLILTGVLLSSVIWGYAVYFLPVGSVDGRTIYKYQLDERLNRFAGNTIKSMGKEIAFEKAMSDLQISINEADVDKEFNEMIARYGGSTEVEGIMLDMMGNTESLRQSVKSGMLKQKAIENFAMSVKASKEELDSFFNENSSDYTDFDTDYEKIKADYRMEVGAKKYDEYISNYEEKVKIKIY